MHAWAVFKQLLDGKNGSMVLVDRPIVKVDENTFTVNVPEPMPFVYSEPDTGIAMGLKVVQTIKKDELWDYLCSEGNCCHVCGEPLKDNHICFNVQSNL